MDLVGSGGLGQLWQIRSLIVDYVNHGELDHLKCISSWWSCVISEFLSVSQ